MKAKTQSLRKLIALMALTIGALLLNVYWILGLNVRVLSAIPRVPAVACSNADKQSYRTNHGRSIQLDPVLNLARLVLSEGKEYEGTGRNIFSMSVPTRVTSDPPRPEPPLPPTQELPAKRRFPLKFFGFATLPNAPKKIFLSQDSDVFVGSEGDIVDRRYKILRIGRQSIDVEDLLDDSQQTLPLNQG